MSQEKPRIPEAASQKQDFPRPDTARTAQGAPAHETPQGSPQAEDRAHGYGQESGYSASGGPPSAEEQKAAEEPTFTSKDKSSIAHLTDEQIRDAIHQRLTEHPDSHPGTLEVDIGDGMVTLKGEVASDREAQELETMVRGIRAVKGVKRELRITGKP